MSQRRLRSGYVSANALSVSNSSRSRLDFASFNIRPPGRCDRFHCRAARVPRERFGDASIVRIASAGERFATRAIVRVWTRFDVRTRLSA
jgi:hypothetical protein